MSKPKARRLAATKARWALSAILREFRQLEQPSSSIPDRAVRLGIYDDDVGVVLPVADFECAVEIEEALDDLLVELAVADRLARGPGREKSVEEFAHELGLAAALGSD